MFQFHQKEVRYKNVDLNISNSGEVLSRVEVWEFQKPQDSNVDITNNDFAIFTGYENYSGFPTYLYDLQTQWKEFYANSNGIKFSMAYDLLPHAIGGVYYDSFQTLSPDGNPILIRLYMNTPSWPQNANDLAVNDAKNKLKKLADTVSLTK